MANATLGYILHSGKNSKAGYYLKAGFRDILPDSLFRRCLQRELDTCVRLYDEQYVQNRVDAPRPLGTDATSIGSLKRSGNASTYYYYSRQLLQCTSPTLRWNYLFGDIRDIPPHPTIVKSRSIELDNSSSVLLKLDRCRHYVYLDDHRPFEAKADRAILRGQMGSRKKHILFYQHLDYRYIMALEGNDVASNQRWIMSSNSLAVMPRPTCETWLKEERLVSSVHYMEVASDFSNLEAQLDYYRNHPKEATVVAANANRYVQQFRDERRERYIELLVMQKYFSITQ